MYSHQLQTEMQTLHGDLLNFEGFFRGGKYFKRVENYNENGIYVVVLFIEALDLNGMEFKKELVLRR